MAFKVIRILHIRDKFKIFSHRACSKICLKKKSAMPISKFLFDLLPKPLVEIVERMNTYAPCRMISKLIIYNKNIHRCVSQISNDTSVRTTSPLKVIYCNCIMFYQFFCLGGVALTRQMNRKMDKQGNFCIPLNIYRC